MSEKVKLVRLELHATHACNLTCESCAHYSNHGHAGSPLTAEEADFQMGLWSMRVAPQIFSVLGGEPTLNPALTGVVAAAVHHFDHVEVATNGFFLDRHPDLPSALARGRGHKRIAITEHHGSPEYEAAFERAMGILGRWQESYHQIEFDVRRLPAKDATARKWTRRYLGYGRAMRPYDDGDPRKSWEVCPAKSCVQLLGGALWKCPILAYLPMQVARFPEIGESYRLGLAYRPLWPGCSEAELRSWAAREDEEQCGLCPSEVDEFEPASPLISARSLLGRGAS